MSDTDQNKEQAHKDADDRSPKVGALLRASRLRVGEDLRDISDVLCIRYLYLEAIEDCRYADLPGNTYAVGFIRSYAEHLGLDGDEVVRRYRLEQTGQRNATDLAFPTPVPDSGVPKGAIVFIGVLIALLVYGGWYVTTTDESILSDLISPVPDHLKHLVTGDDAPNGAGTEATDKTTEQVEKVVRETTAAAEQMADAADEAAQRTAEAAAEAAATASDAVNQTAESAPENVGESSESAVTEATPAESMDSTTESAASTAEPAAENAVPTATESNESTAAAPADVDTAPDVTGAETESAETAAAPTETEVETPVPATETMAQSGDTASAGGNTSSSTEAAVAPTTTETGAAATEQPGSAVASGTSEAVTSEPLEAPTPAPAEDTVASETASTESETPQAAAPVSPEVTAEDLNTLVLRQATGGSGGSSDNADTPAPPETASLASSDATSTSGIVIRATSSSWVEIRDPANSTIVYTGLMSAGNSFNVPDAEGLVLDTGNAGALDISVDGEPVPKLGGVGAVRKNVSLNAGRLKAGTATNR